MLTPTSGPHTEPRKQQALRQQGTLNPHPEAVTSVLFQGNEFFDPRDLLQVKYEMVRRVDVEGAPVSQTTGEFGFSRPSFYQAQAALKQSGLRGLLPQKRGPRQGHKLTAAILDFAARLRAGEPALRWEELADQIGQRFGVRVHPRSIERAFHRRQKKRR